jgi:hypothetical protein
MAFLKKLLPDPWLANVHSEIEAKIVAAVDAANAARVGVRRPIAFHEMRSYYIDDRGTDDARQKALQLIDPGYGHLSWEDDEHLNEVGSMRVEQLFRIALFNDSACAQTLMQQQARLVNRAASHLLVVDASCARQGDAAAAAPVAATDLVRQVGRSSALLTARAGRAPGGAAAAAPVGRLCRRRSAVASTTSSPPHARSRLRNRLHDDNNTGTLHDDNNTGTRARPSVPPAPACCC